MTIFKLIRLLSQDFSVEGDLSAVKVEYAAERLC